MGCSHNCEELASSKFRSFYLYVPQTCKGLCFIWEKLWWKGQKGAPEWKPPGKGWNKRKVNTPGIARHGMKQQEDAPFSPSVGSFRKVFILSLIFSPERAKNSFILRHNTIENIIARACEDGNYNMRYTLEGCFWGWKVMRTFKVLEF